MPEEKIEPLQLAPPSSRNRESARERGRSDATVALRMRLWAFAGTEGKLCDLPWAQDKPVAELIQQVIGSCHGSVAAEDTSFLVAQFADPLHALAAAKSLQQRLLSFHREPPAGQVVAAILVGKQATLQGNSAEDPLADANRAQILVSEGIYDVARTIPGFDFSSKPVREAAEGRASEALYELRWTDESTYGHLRKTNSAAAPTLSPVRRYTIQSELGRGCMGVVYKAYDEVIGRSVALKTIAVNRNFPNRNELIERLKQEAKAAGSLDHPNIITIYDVGQEEDLLYLSMQLVEGETLSALLAGSTVPPLIDLLAYAEQICNAVGFAHQRGVIHRDLKPANFMLTSQGMIKVLDFGIAKLEDATITQTGMIVGTPTYMAPEQAKAKKVDQRSDIFSLGSVFYELFTREKPFKGDITTVLYKLIHEDPPPPSVINPALPIGIDTIIRKALAKDPAERFQTCEEMRDAFREQAVLLQPPAVSQPAAPVAAAPPPVTVQDLLAEVRPARPRSHRRIWMALPLFLLLAAVGVGGWAFRAKVRTGSLPPALIKVLGKLKLGKPQSSAANASSGQQASLEPSAISSNPASSADDTAKDSQTVKVDQSNTPAGAVTIQPPAQLAQTSSTTDATSQPPSANSDSAATQPVSATASPAAVDSEESHPKDVDPFAPRKHNQKASAPQASDAAVKVEGFSRRDVPDLLSRADDAAGRGDYRLARYEYNIILRLDRQNAAARAGLRRVVEAEQEH